MGKLTAPISSNKAPERLLLILAFLVLRRIVVDFLASMPMEMNVLTSSQYV